jgi:hypothetical protein
LIPSHIRISKAIDISSGGEHILELVADKKKWSLWHPAYEQGNDSARNKWVQETTWKKVEHNDSLVIVELIPKGQHPIVNGWQLYRHDNTAPLTLQWYMDFHLSWYPWQKFSSLFYEGTYGKIMEKGLSNLKEQAPLR